MSGLFSYTVLFVISVYCFGAMPHLLLVGLTVWANRVQQPLKMIGTWQFVPFVDVMHVLRSSNTEYCVRLSRILITTRHVCMLYRVLQADKGMVCEQLKILIGRNLIKEMEPDKWVRNVLDKTTGTCFRKCVESGMHTCAWFLQRNIQYDKW